jgi:hypothetical protein
MFDDLMHRDVDQIAVAVIDWSTYAGKIGKSTFLAELLNRNEDSTTSKLGQGKTVLNTPHIAANGQARQGILGRLQQHITARLGFAEAIDRDQPLNEIGLDSLMSVVCRIASKTNLAFQSQSLNSSGDRLLISSSTLSLASWLAPFPQSEMTLREPRCQSALATGRLARGTPVRIISAILTGVHQPGESHFELLRAFADDAVLDQISTEIRSHSYRNHEFGGSILVECRPSLFSERNSNTQCLTA